MVVAEGVCVVVAEGVSALADCTKPTAEVAAIVFAASLRDIFGASAWHVNVNNVTFNNSVIITSDFMRD
jgi:hypothetical protein